jgi:uncharacterized protein (DUF952 family)
MIYIITKEADWKAAKPTGFFETASLKDEKQRFIHASNEDQVVRSANKHYKGQSGLVLLEVDPGKVKVGVKYENTSSGTDLYPHIYGALNTDAVTTIYPFPSKPDGTFELPKLKAITPAKAIKGASLK